MSILLIAVVAIVLIGVYMYFSYNNREVALRKEAKAQNKKIASVHDTMWKILKEKAGVSEQYRETFEKIYPEIISGRYANDGGSTMKWIQESNPDFDTFLYKDLMQAIEVQRTYFSNAQQRMLDIIRERETLIESMPAKWFVKNKSVIEYTVDAPTLESNTKAYFREHESLDLLSFVSWLRSNLYSWKRKEFKDFSYLGIHLSPKKTVLFVIISIVLSVLLCWGCFAMG